MHVGTLIPHFKKGDFDKLYIPLPNKELQILTGDLFYEMSEKIEQNRRTSAALERLVRAIFRAWFVDFEPVKAKAAGATSFPSMPQPIFNALPIHLAETNMGPHARGIRNGPADMPGRNPIGRDARNERCRILEWQYWMGKRKGYQPMRAAVPARNRTHDHTIRFGSGRNSNCSSICDRRRRAGCDDGTNGDVCRAVRDEPDMLCVGVRGRAVLRKLAVLTRDGIDGPRCPWERL